jgi:hypothetical protein
MSIKCTQIHPIDTSKMSNFLFHLLIIRLRHLLQPHSESNSIIYCSGHAAINILLKYIPVYVALMVTYDTQT